MKCVKPPKIPHEMRKAVEDLRAVAHFSSSAPPFRAARAKPALATTSPTLFSALRGLLGLSLKPRCGCTARCAVQRPAGTSTPLPHTTLHYKATPSNKCVSHYFSVYHYSPSCCSVDCASYDDLVSGGSSWHYITHACFSCPLFPCSRQQQLLRSVPSPTLRLRVRPPRRLFNATFP